MSGNEELPDREPGYLERQAADLIDADTTAVELVADFDVSRYRYGDSYPDWHASTPFAPVFRAILLRELAGWSDPELTRRLTATPAMATALGFDPDNVPDRSTFTRARNSRFDAIDSRLADACERIRRLAAERGSPIGAAAFEPAETTGTSERTVQRLLRGKAAEVLDEMAWTVFPAYEFDRPPDPVYDESALLELETLLGIENQAANGGSQTYGDVMAPEAALDAPFYEDGPTGETLLEAIKGLSIDDIAAMHNAAAARLLTRAKPHAEFSRRVLLAIDITYVAYYGEREGMAWVQGAPPEKEYEWCHRFATAAVVGDDAHFTVAMLPIGNVAARDTAAYPGPDQSYRTGEVVRQLLARATEHVQIETVVADREFHAADVVAACEAEGVDYLIPARENERVGRFLDRMDEQVTVEQDHAMYGAVRGGVSNERVVTTLVGLPANERRERPQAFITNLDVDDEIGLDRRQTARRINRYTRRGGIETAYKKIKEFAAWTTSKAFSVRLFHFGFAVLLYDMWVLVDFLVQVSLDIVEYRVKPRITAGRFRALLSRHLRTLI
jgi:hypothetical protein